MIEKITSSQQAMDLEAKYGAHNYHPLPVVLAKPRCGMSKEKSILTSCRLIPQSTKVTATQKSSRP